jgi:hypothetical protein
MLKPIIEFTLNAKKKKTSAKTHQPSDRNRNPTNNFSLKSRPINRDHTPSEKGARKTDTSIFWPYLVEE